METKPAYYKATIPNKKRRAVWHNYYDRGQYMITINKQAGIPAFGSLEYQLPKEAFISLSSLGLVIKGEIEKTPSFSPEIEIHEYEIMPDHLHILIEATAPMSRHLGDIIQSLKSASTSRIRKMLGSHTLMVFEEGFHDRIITGSEQFETVKRYIRENPRRLAVRREHPEYFRRVNDLKIGDKTYQAYGNFQLLDCPFKEQVVVHRADTEEIRRLNRERWLYTAANGGVLVSPFVSAAEKAILVEAEGMGGRFILITNEPMGERYKPSRRDFELCETGRMLIISANLPGAVTRQTCMVMNALAQAIII